MSLNVSCGELLPCSIMNANAAQIEFEMAVSNSIQPWARVRGRGVSTVTLIATLGHVHFWQLALQNMSAMGSGPSRSRRGSTSPTRLPPSDSGAASRDPSPPLSPGRPSPPPPPGLPAPDPPPASASHPLELPSPPAPAPAVSQSADAGFPASSQSEPAAPSSSSVAAAAGDEGVQGSSRSHHARLPSTSEAHSEHWDASQHVVSHSAPVSRQVSQTSSTMDASSRTLLPVRAGVSVVGSIRA